jgi:O-antigen/teichoic acid export membrane protein
MSAAERSLTHRAIGGALWMTSGKLAYAVMQLGVLAVLGRLLAPADFGVLSAALVVIAFSAILSQVGLGPALVQRPELEPRHIQTALAGAIGLGVLLAAGTWSLAPFAARFFDSQPVQPVLRALALLFPLSGLGTVAESLARRDLQFRWLARLDVVCYTAGYGLVALPLAFTGYGVWALVAGEIAESSLRTVLLLDRFRPSLRHWPERRAFGELMYFGGGFTLAKVANFFAVRGDNLMVGHLLGPAALGLYGRAYQLMSAPAQGLGTILDQVLFASMARVQTEVRRVRAAFRRGIAVMAVLIMPATGIAVVLGPEIIRVLLGPRWDAVVPPFRILALGMLFQNNSKLGDSLARALGAVYRRAWRQVLYAALVVSGAYIGQRWDIVGVAWGVLLAITVNFLMMTQLSLRLSGMSWAELVEAHLPGVRVTLASTLLVWGSAVALRAWTLPAALILAGSLGTAVLGTLAVVRWQPRRFLGGDALFMLEKLQAFLPARLRPGVPRKPALPQPAGSTGVAQ